MFESNTTIHQNTSGIRITAVGSRALPITKWKYKGTDEYHIGPMAQDFKTSFNVGVDDKSISTLDPAGISLAALQELIKEIEILKKRIALLESKQQQ